MNLPIYYSIKSNQVNMNFNKSGIVMASIGNINRGIYLIIDVVDYKMWPKPWQACLLGRLEDG